MGNALSHCLGGGRRESVDEDEESRLLFEDPSNLQYGSFGDQYMGGQEDPMEAQRETEALQRVVAKASDNMVDIFEIAPQDDSTPRPAPTPFAYAGQEARLVRYQHLLAKLAAHDEGVQVDWLPGQDDDPPIELQRGDQPRSGALVGTFADAAAAMA